MSLTLATWTTRRQGFRASRPMTPQPAQDYPGSLAPTCGNQPSSRCDCTPAVQADDLSSTATDVASILRGQLSCRSLPPPPRSRGCSCRCRRRSPRLHAPYGSGDRGAARPHSTARRRAGGALRGHSVRRRCPRRAAARLPASNGPRLSKASRPAWPSRGRTRLAARTERADTGPNGVTIMRGDPEHVARLAAGRVETVNARGWSRFAAEAGRSHIRYHYPTTRGNYEARSCFARTVSGTTTLNPPSGRSSNSTPSAFRICSTVTTVDRLKSCVPNSIR